MRANISQLRDPWHDKRPFCKISYNLFCYSFPARISHGEHPHPARHQIISVPLHLSQTPVSLHICLDCNTTASAQWRQKKKKKTQCTACLLILTEALWVKKAVNSLKGVIFFFSDFFPWPTFHPLRLHLLPVLFPLCLRLSRTLGLIAALFFQPFSLSFSRTL